MTKSFLDLELNPFYSSGSKYSPDQFYKITLLSAQIYKRAAGYFSSQVFDLFSNEVLNFASREGKIYLVCSPYLSAADIKKIADGYHEREKIIENCLNEEIDRLLKDDAGEHALPFLSTLIKNRILEIKIATTKEGQLFHDKTGILEDMDANKISFRGSINESSWGWSKKGNYETFDVFKSWNSIDLERIRTHEDHFNRLWNNLDPNLTVIPFPEVSIKKLLEFSRNDFSEFNSAIFKVNSKSKVSKNYKTDKLMEHQSEAIRNWQKNDSRGIFKHATGSGKTVSAIRIVKDHIVNGNPALILVPSALLLRQWLKELQDEINELNILIAGDNNVSWKERGQIKLFCSSRPGKIGSIILSTNATASKKEFQEKLINQKNTLVVADEVHTIGSNQNKSIFNNNFKKRLGLSATPERYMDKDGTNRILSYFGGILNPVVTLSDAIKSGRLVPYYYYIKPVYFLPNEEDQWESLTKRIINLSRQVNNNKKDKKLKDMLEKALINRARIAKKASNKTIQIEKIINEDFEKSQHWVVFCEDEEQLEEVNSLLRGSGFDPYIYHTNLDGNPTLELEQFTKNAGIMLSIRCLDEGVDIPIISHAVVAASSKNPRQFIQRRGRVLRSHKAKSFAYIYDCLVTPNPNSMNSSYDSLIYGELYRSLEFAASAQNNYGAQATLRATLMKMMPDKKISDLMIDEENE